MPRKANGSPCRPATMASTSGLGREGMLVPGDFLSGHLLDYAQDPVERDRHPGWPVGQLVGNLVDGLFEGKEIDQRLGLQLARRIGRAAAHLLAVGGAEAVDRALPPG